jgi:hypothetical protein
MGEARRAASHHSQLAITDLQRMNRAEVRGVHRFFNRLRALCVAMIFRALEGWQNG